MTTYSSSGRALPYLKDDMQIRNTTKGGITISEIAELKTAESEFRFVAVLKGYLQPIMYNEQGINEEANMMRGDHALDLIIKE